SPYEVQVRTPEQPVEVVRRQKRQANDPGVCVCACSKPRSGVCRDQQQGRTFPLCQCLVKMRDRGIAIAEKGDTLGLSGCDELYMPGRHAKLRQKACTRLDACLERVPALQQVRLAQQASCGQCETGKEKILGDAARLR